jgi:hypothetical protein
LFRFIDNDPEELASYIKSLERGLVVFDGRDGNGKTYMAYQMQRRLPCKAIDADCCFLVPKQDEFVGALLLEQMRSCLEAHLARTPLVVLSTLCGREVVERAGLDATAFVWIERVDENQRHAARDWYADDRGANPVIEGGPPRGPLLDELEHYVEAYKAREQPDVVFLNIRDEAYSAVSNIGNTWMPEE